MSCVFQNIDPPPPSPPGECVPPLLCCGGEGTLAGWRGGWGVNILEDTRHSSVLYLYQILFAWCIKEEDDVFPIHLLDCYRCAQPGPLWSGARRVRLSPPRMRGWDPAPRTDLQSFPGLKLILRRWLSYKFLIFVVATKPTFGTFRYFLCGLSGWNEHFHFPKNLLA